MIVEASFIAILRNALFYNDAIAGLLGFLINLFLLYLIIRIKDTEFSCYRRILIHSIIYDMLLSPTNTLATLSMEATDSALVLWTGGASKYFPKNVALSFVSLHMWAFNVSYCNNGIVFFYRYYVIIKSTPLPTRYYLILLSINIFANGLGALVLYISCLNVNESLVIAARQYLPNQFFVDIHGKETTFFILHPYEVTGGIFLFSISLTTTTTIFLVTLYYVMITRFLASQNFKMSEYTKNLQKQLNVTMIAHVFVPIIVFFLPFIIISILSVLNLPTKGITTCFFFAFEWLPLINALITLTCLKKCRYEIIKLLGCCKKTRYKKGIMIRHSISPFTPINLKMKNMEHLRSSN
uniref:G_PROTEIN_RECEP_F1_2 domain-containing protein n=1 Tax=Rhabditophanes sp. KR3021 TaxID=114890 RepID=A0AC35TXL7_9BILA